MLTYNLSSSKGAIYKNLYEFIKQDIKSGKLRPGEKIPSKRMLAKNLGISTISVENAYAQLISEGFIYSVEKKGYFISNLPNFPNAPLNKITKNISIKMPKKDESITFDFSSNQIESENFPFSVWAKIMRENISHNEKKLLEVSPCCGVWELRSAISEYLQSFRGMDVNPDQIIIGAGTEYLYSLLIKLFGTEKIYCIENPGYGKLKRIYESNNASCCLANLDNQGIIIEDLVKQNADIAHISPTHHFPTGITMPASRRYEVLAWANEKNGRYIIEDDYDSEFRLNGNPIPPLQNLDSFGKVVYMNTFSKSLASTIRISYMILPEQLANDFYEKLSFYSCTVSTFEQYALADFISQGHFEKHINRMRLHYGRKRAEVMEIIKTHFSENECQIIENDSGLHFLLEFHTALSDHEIKSRLLEKNIKITSITDFNMNNIIEDKHQFILNYSNMNSQKLDDALKVVKEILKE